VGVVLRYIEVGVVLLVLILIEFSQDLWVVLFFKELRLLFLFLQGLLLYDVSATAQLVFQHCDHLVLLWLFDAAVEVVLEGAAHRHL
jgi:hypothetical protein